MASPQSGTSSSVDPAESPLEAADADVADPGQAAEAREAAPGEGAGSDETSETEDVETEESHWIAIKLEDHEGRPAMQARYKVKLPDGSERSGSLDKEGKALLKPIPAGQCEISFPDIHQDEWSLK